MTLEFRAWDKWRKEYSSSFGFIDIDGGYYDGRLNIHNDPQNEDFILEQYTGLKDVEGNKIFEGDIVALINEEWSTGGLITGTVQYLTPQFTFDSAGVGRPGIWKVLDDGCRVIGNIHENPELLEVEK